MIPFLAGHEKLAACGVVFAFGLMQWRGIRIGDIAQQATSLVKALALVALALIALVVAKTPAPAVGHNRRTDLADGHRPVGAVIIAMQSAIYTYDGWTGPVYFSEELQDPVRDVPAR